MAADGHGVTFTPSLFCDHAVTVVDPRLPPRIWYPARGLATVWHTDAAVAPQALADLLGRTRARILTALAQPAGTTDLAHQLGLSPSTVSQHLGVLHRAGLVTRARHRHVVLYLRSPLGHRLSLCRRGGLDHPLADLHAGGSCVVCDLSLCRSGVPGRSPGINHLLTGAVHGERAAQYRDVARRVAVHDQ
ncbi:ArsR/SmtB family transcription factor [Micromonospora sp. BL4]|uniref:ArsR/SmtB family transcription factor n=1 Tax=Micromonospora sp. BL4 TaxID=2478710 RepID=UPI0034CFC695